MPISQIQKAASDLLGTLVTTSGAAATLAGLDLKDYRFLKCVLNDVSADGNVAITQNGVALSGTLGIGGSQVIKVKLDIDLETGLGFVEGGAVAGLGYQTGVNKNSTQISFNTGAGNFDNGSIKIYGER
jgi:hypothetical protein